MRKGPRRWLFEVRWATRLFWWKLKCHINDLVAGPRYSQDPQVVLMRALTRANFHSSVQSTRMFLFSTPEERRAEILHQAEEFNRALVNLQDELAKFTAAKPNSDTADQADQDRIN